MGIYAESTIAPCRVVCRNIQSDARLCHRPTRWSNNWLKVLQCICQCMQHMAWVRCHLVVKKLAAGIQAINLLGMSR